MRIIEEEGLPQTADDGVTATPAKITKASKLKKNHPLSGEVGEIDVPAKQTKRQASQPLNRHSCLKLFGCFILMLLAVFAAVGYLVIFVAGPIVKTVNELPKDFPKSLVLYQIDKAKIKVQNPGDKLKAAQLIKALPAWLLNPFVGYLSTEMKTQILSVSQNSTSTDLANLEKALTGDTKTVSLSWNSLNKTKEELADYYKKQLKSNGFEVKENISDYEIDLSFIRGGITGAMTLADSFMNDNGSLMKMTINYLSGN